MLRGEKIKLKNGTEVTFLSFLKHSKKEYMKCLLPSGKIMVISAMERNISMDPI